MKAWLVALPIAIALPAAAGAQAANRKIPALPSSPANWPGSAVTPPRPKLTATRK